MWEKVPSNIKNIAKDMLGLSKEKAPNSKSSLWWNQNVQEKIKNKKICYKKWFRCKNSNNWEIYKEAGKESKKVIYDAKSLAFNDLFNRLDTKAGKRYMYMLAN